MKYNKIIVCLTKTRTLLSRRFFADDMLDDAMETAVVTGQKLAVPDNLVSPS